MYSSRLRHSPYWAAAINDLTDPNRLNLHEASIASHDVSISASFSQAETHNKPVPAQHTRKSALGADGYKHASSANVPTKHTTENVKGSEADDKQTFILGQERTAAALSQLSSDEDIHGPQTHTVHFLFLTPHDLAPSAYLGTIGRLAALPALSPPPNETYSNAIIFLFAPVEPNTASGVADRLHLPSATETHTPDDGIILDDVPASIVHAHAQKSEVLDAVGSHAMNQDTHKNPQMAYMQLQAAVMTAENLRDLVVLPITKVEDGTLTNALDKHVKAATMKKCTDLAPKKVESAPKANASKTLTQTAIEQLLPAATIAPHGLNEHFTIALTDLYASVREFAAAMDSERGRDRLVTAFVEDAGAEGKEAAESILAFWSEEWVYEP